MVFDLNAQMKLAQSITQLTLRNISAATETANNAGTKTTPNRSRTTTASTDGGTLANPFADMMDPSKWMEMMSQASRQNQTTPQQPSIWWPLNPKLLSMTPPSSSGLSDLGLPNMAIPLGTNPFAPGQTGPKFSLPILSRKSPLAGANAPEWPNMFWWLVQGDSKDEIDAADENSATPNPFAMIMDPFNLLDEIETDPEHIEEEAPVEEERNLFDMMIDPFGILTNDEKKPPARKRAARRPKTTKQSARALDFFDPLGIMKSFDNSQNLTKDDDAGRNMFVGFQPSAKHPLMNSGKPTGMFYMAIALPKEIQSINPQLPPWNLAL